MYDVVPGVLQRLREADIVSVAGLQVASLGQEFCRIGAVHSTKRQGARISGIVDVPTNTFNQPAQSTNGARKTENANTYPGRYSTEVEVRDRTTWNTSCTCKHLSNSSSICSHAAALLYDWLSHPETYLTPGSNSPAISSFKQDKMDLSFGEQKGALAPATNPLRAGFAPAQQVPLPASSIDEILSQLGLSELRTIAREYDIATTGLNKQQLSETLLEALKQPEAIRRVVGTLEKPQRQLLAALTLAGGSMSDDDLRGLFERFSLGSPNQLQNMLVALSNRALIFHTSLNSSLQQRIGLSGSLLDVGWHVPLEVRTALRVSLPITPFDLHKSKEQESATPTIQLAEPFRMLADLLLIARAVDGYRPGGDDVKSARSGPVRTFNLPPTDGSIALPAPGSIPAPSLLALLEDVAPTKDATPFLSPAPTYLRFVVRLLRLADILYQDDGENSPLHVLPNAARLLLGPTRAEVARELFSHWLTSPTYEELFDLQEHGLRLRCRATPLGQPALRTGELELENSEARRTLVALLAKAPPNQWISFSAFARFVYRLNPTFLQKRQRLFSSPHWWFEQEEGRTLRPTQLSDWLRAEGRYLARLLEGPLHWWGASDIASSNDGQLLAFRLTPLSSFLFSTMSLDKDTESVDAGSSPLSVFEFPLETTLGELESTAETGEIFIPCSSTQWPLIELIESFAEITGVHNGKLRYRLSPRSLSDALAQGKNPGAMLELLRNAEQPFSEMLAWLERRIANYGRVRLYTGGTLLEVADTLVLRELSATTSFDKQVVQSISPTLLILKKQGAERLIEELKRRGQVPLLHEEECYGAE